MRKGPVVCLASRGGGWGRGRKAPIDAAPAPALHLDERIPYPHPPIIPLTQIQKQSKNCPWAVFRVFRVRELAGRSGSSSKTPPLNPPRRSKVVGVAHGHNSKQQGKRYRPTHMRLLHQLQLRTQHCAAKKSWPPPFRRYDVTDRLLVTARPDAPIVWWTVAASARATGGVLWVWRTR